MVYYCRPVLWAKLFVRNVFKNTVLRFEITSTKWRSINNQKKIIAMPTCNIIHFKKSTSLKYITSGVKFKYSGLTTKKKHHDNNNDQFGFWMRIALQQLKMKINDDLTHLSPSTLLVDRSVCFSKFTSQYTLRSFYFTISPLT